LGYGYPAESFREGLGQDPDAIVVDAGSTDAGPHKLGAGVAIVSRTACRKDLEPLVAASLARKIPLVIGSAGGSGAKRHVEWTYDILAGILGQMGRRDARVAVVWADIPRRVVGRALKRGALTPMGPGVPALTPERLARTTRVVAQMGHEPIVAALATGADIILCGRAYDPAPFAAVCLGRGLDPALAYHMGKILECAALCAEPGSAKDCMLGTLYPDSFVVSPLSPGRRCTPLSVAAHTFYEKDHPYLLHGPGWVLDLRDCEFLAEKDGRSVRVRGSRLRPAEAYAVKLEGACRAAYRTFVVAGVRDPLVIARLPELEEGAKRQVAAYYPEYAGYTIRFINYGLDGVMGAMEPGLGGPPPREVGVVMDVLAADQETADTLCATLRSTLLHYGFEGRKSTAGNLAFPFAPSDVRFGPVYEFSVYHLLPAGDPCGYFPIEVRTAHV
jgi:hypothetical protein